ncbi:MAG: D-sedoheptulose 7-phosphate isomerase [Bacteroidales bacterium]|nr:D-sedoheptulose 7-phosphate isomerase [Bacteroidales bacterium]
MIKVIEKQIADSINVKQQLLASPALLLRIEKAALNIIAAFRNSHKVLIAGNGGSAADAQHIAGEFVSRFYFDRPGLPSVALTTDTSILTAIGNDYGYEKLFARQIEALGVSGDVFLGISTSGNSPNLIEAFKICREKKIISVALTGSSGGQMKDICDICIMVPSTETPRIQESHILIGHIICGLVEEELFGHLKPCKQ